MKNESLLRTTKGRWAHLVGVSGDRIVEIWGNVMHNKGHGAEITYVGPTDRNGKANLLTERFPDRKIVSIRFHDGRKR